MCTLKVTMGASNAPRGLWKLRSMLRLRFLHEQALVRTGTYNQLKMKQSKYLASLVLCCELGPKEADRDMPKSEMFDRLLVKLLPWYLTQELEALQGEDTSRRNRGRRKLAAAVGTSSSV